MQSLQNILDDHLYRQCPLDIKGLQYHNNKGNVDGYLYSAVDILFISKSTESLRAIFKIFTDICQSKSAKEWLAFAANNRDPQSLSLLLEYNAHVYHPDNIATVRSALNGSMPCLQLLKSHNALHDPTGEGLFGAIKSHYVDIFMLLSKNKPGLIAQSDKLHEVLTIFCTYEEKEQVCLAILKALLTIDYDIDHCIPFELFLKALGKEYVSPMTFLSSPDMKPPYSNYILAKL